MELLLLLGLLCLLLSLLSALSASHSRYLHYRFLVLDDSSEEHLPHPRASAGGQYALHKRRILGTVYVLMTYVALYCEREIEDANARDHLNEYEHSQMLGRTSILRGKLFLHTYQYIVQSRSVVEIARIR
jgi:hypothetical protein